LGILLLGSSMTAAADVPTNPPPAALPRFSLLAILLLTTLVAIIFAAIFAMPFYTGTLVLIVLNLCLAPVSMTGAWCGRDYLRIACIGMLLPGLAAWWLTFHHFETLTELLETSGPCTSLIPVVGQAELRLPPATTAPAVATPLLAQSGYTPVDPFGAPAPPVGTPQSIASLQTIQVSSELGRFRFSMIANLALAAAGAICAVATKCASDSQPTSPS
jgi:hypothetical protein